MIPEMKKYMKEIYDFVLETDQLNTGYIVIPNDLYDCVLRVVNNWNVEHHLGYIIGEVVITRPSWSKKSVIVLPLREFIRRLNLIRGFSSKGEF